MAKKILIIGIVFLLTFSLVEAFDCGPNSIPELPHIFYGYAKYSGNVLQDKTVTATLGGNEFSTTTDSEGYYYLNVWRCSNDTSTSITFNVCTRTASETATYSKGEVTHLNLAISSDCACHEADTDGDGKISNLELAAYANRWYLDSSDVSSLELAQAANIWYGGGIE